jgi:hypothetical protein
LENKQEHNRNKLKKQTIEIAKKLTFAVKHSNSDRINGSTAKVLEIGN